MHRSPLPHRQAKASFYQHFRASTVLSPLPIVRLSRLNFQGLHCSRRGIAFSVRRDCLSTGIPSLKFGYHYRYSIAPSATAVSSGRTFSSTAVAMVATKIDGTNIAKGVREGLKSEIEKVQGTNPRFVPSLVILQGRFVPCIAFWGENSIRRC